MQRVVSSTSLIQKKTQNSRFEVFKEAVFVAAICGIFPGKEGNNTQDENIVKQFTEQFKYHPVVYDYEDEDSLNGPDEACDEYGYVIEQAVKSKESEEADEEKFFGIKAKATLFHQEKNKPSTKGIPMLSSRMSFDFPLSRLKTTSRDDLVVTLKPLVVEALLNLLQTHRMTCHRFLTLFKPSSEESISDYLEENSYYIDALLSGSDWYVGECYQHKVKIKGVCVANGNSKQNAAVAQQEAYASILENIQCSLNPRDEKEFYMRMIACNMAKNNILTQETWDRVTSQEQFSNLYLTLKDINEQGELANYRFVECLNEIGITTRYELSQKGSVSRLSLSASSQAESGNSESPSTSSQEKSVDGVNTSNLPAVEEFNSWKKNGMRGYAFKFLPPPSGSWSSLPDENVASRVNQSDSASKSLVSTVSDDAANAAQSKMEITPSDTAIVELFRPHVC